VFRKANGRLPRGGGSQPSVLPWALLLTAGAYTVLTSVGTFMYWLLEYL
jgi:hypothetical protein